MLKSKLWYAYIAASEIGQKKVAEQLMISSTCRATEYMSRINANPIKDTGTADW